MDEQEENGVRCDNFALKRPCANCPFLAEGAIELRPGRVQQIVTGLLADDYSIFVCHKTLDAAQTSACMGALAYQWRARRLPVSARLALRFADLTVADLEAAGQIIVDPLFPDHAHL